MKVVYLRSALPDLVWMRRCYSSVFPEGARGAEAQLLAVIKLLSENPGVGHLSPFGEALEFPILRTPFSIEYRVKQDRIEVLRIRDQRRNPETKHSET